jgi:hypothetical protein
MIKPALNLSCIVKLLEHLDHERRGFLKSAFVAGGGAAAWAIAISRIICGWSWIVHEPARADAYGVMIMWLCDCDPPSLRRG